MSCQIVGIPKSDYDYEFMVVTDADNGNYKFSSNHERYDDAEKAAKEIGGKIVHDLRVSGRKRKNPKVESYSFELAEKR